MNHRISYLAFINDPFTKWFNDHEQGINMCLTRYDSVNCSIRKTNIGINIGQPFTHASLIGTTFVGRLVERTMVGPFPAVVPTVRGRAWITGFAQYLLDPE